MRGCGAAGLRGCGAAGCGAAGLRGCDTTSGGRSFPRSCRIRNPRHAAPISFGDRLTTSSRVRFHSLDQPGASTPLRMGRGRDDVRHPARFAGVRAVPAVLMLPLEQEFGWLRTTTSAALSVNILLYGLTGPFAGSLMARVGVRRVVLSALALLAVGAAIAPFIRQRWQLMALWGIGIGVGTGLVAVVLAATVVNRWFVARRGTVLGVLTASASTGQLVFLPMLAHATERWGWRAAVLIMAAIVAALIPLARGCCARVRRAWDSVHTVRSWRRRRHPSRIRLRHGNRSARSPCFATLPRRATSGSSSSPSSSAAPRRMV